MTQRTRLRDLRKRVVTVIQSAQENYSGNIPLKSFVSPVSLNRRAPVDVWGSLYPAAVPSPSFALRYEIILGQNGAELCFCIGMGKPQVRDPDLAVLNRHMLEDARFQLSDVPDSLIASVEKALDDNGAAWSYRSHWRQPPGTKGFDSFGDWLQFAASPRGGGASVSCNLSLLELNKLGDRVAEKYMEMMRIFQPVMEYVYGDENVAPNTDEHSELEPAVEFVPALPPVRQLVDERTIDQGITSMHRALPDKMLDRYTLDDAVAGLFVTRDELSRMLNLLKTKQNLILEGAPGVGKTLIAQRLAYAVIGHKDPSRIEMVQFHQSYAYEDFVQGWRPNGSGSGFTLKAGVFYDFCKQAQVDPGRSYVFIIDEINRGNLSRIFGELLLLLEREKRGEEYSVPLTYSRGRTERFSIPKNVYVIGTMNTADRSLAIVDYAIRRRFAFVRLHPAFSSPEFAEFLKGSGVPEPLIKRIVARMTSLNHDIISDRKSLSSGGADGFEIGHSFFCNPPEKGSNKAYDFWYRGVIASEIEPLLREYWFDDPDRVTEQSARLLR